MKPARASYHHGDLRDALVEAAIKLVREGGAESFSLRDAARSVGVTPSATYRHFESKSALLTAVAVAGLAKLAHRMQRKLAETRRASASSGASPRQLAIECFKELGRAYVAFAIEQPQLFRVIHGPHGICQLDPTPETAASSAVLTETLDRLVEVELLPSDRRAGADFRAWTVFHGFAVLATDGSRVFSSAARRAEALEEILDFALEGLCGRRLAAP